MTTGETTRTNITMHPIGVIRTPFPRPAGTPIQPSRAGGATGTVKIFRPYRQGLKDLEGFDRAWLIYWMHLPQKVSLRVTPFLDDRQRGLFATRAPARPNRIGMSCVRLLRVKGGVVQVADVDIVDGTPLLDIKPYVPEFDCFSSSRAGWLDESQRRKRVADDRFRAGRSKPRRPKDGRPR